MSIKSLAITVATIVLIGVGLVFFKDNIGDWIQTIWDAVWGWISDFFS
ncbi:hypothetical protein AGMMS49975_02300 [Clostridia bacterium]|nr:hypothetical protein AGMMS49975_02300 [Clostridia bacterium]